MSAHLSDDLPDRNSIHDCTVCGGSVSFMCFSASSSSTSPVGSSDRTITWINQYSFQCSPAKNQSHSRNNTKFSIMTIQGSYLSIQHQGLLPRVKLPLKVTLRLRRDLRRRPAFSSSTLPRNASSIRMHPRRPEDMQSFQKLVYPWIKSL